MGMRIAEVCRVHPRGRVYMPCGYFARDLIHYVGRSGLFLAFGIVLTVLRSCVGTRSCVAQKLQCTVHWTWVQHLADPFIWSGGMDRITNRVNTLLALGFTGTVQNTDKTVP